MLKAWRAAAFGIASARSQVGTVGYVLGKRRRMFSILLTKEVKLVNELNNCI